MLYRNSTDLNKLFHLSTRAYTCYNTFKMQSCTMSWHITYILQNNVGANSSDSEKLLVLKMRKPFVYINKCFSLKMSFSFLISQVTDFVLLLSFIV